MEEAKEKLSQPTKWLLEQKTLLPLLTHLKVLSRKEVNRRAVGAKAIAQLLKHLSDQTAGTKIQAEGANVVLNICYEKENVSAVLACGGASTLVTKPNPTLIPVVVAVRLMLLIRSSCLPPCGIG